MTRRIIAVALPHLAAEAQLRREGQAGFPRPFAIVAQEGGALRLVSVNPAAAALGLAPGLGLADARAICPALVTRPEQPERLAAFSHALARWAERFSPIVSATDDGLFLDATGGAHLFGGEAAMLAAIATALASHGLTARPAMADTKGAAWALAHFGGPDGPCPPAPPPRPTTDDTPGIIGARSVVGRGGGAGSGARAGAKNQGAKARPTRTNPQQAPTAFPIAPRGHTRAAIAALPVAALRLDPEAARGLAALGLATIGDAARIPRGALARRFGLATLKRLDQALGAEPEPVAPDRPPPSFAARLTLPEPIGHVADVMAGLERLLARLCQALDTHQMGARTLRLTVRRVDGADAEVRIALARPGRDPARIRELFAPGVAGIEAGFGIDALRLEATAVEPLKPTQTGPAQAGHAPGHTPGRAPESEKLADLLSRIGNRIGFENVIRTLPAESHIPERAFTLAATAWSEPAPWPDPRLSGGGPPRPLTLFPPERLETGAPAASPRSPEPGAPPTPRRPGLEPGPRATARDGGPSAPGSRREAGTMQAGFDPPPGSGQPRNRDPHPLPPPRFRWRRRWLTLATAEGPERLAPEWWWDDPAWRSGLRDYWRIETAQGPRLWLFHTPQGAPPGWWAHGAFA